MCNLKIGSAPCNILYPRKPEHAFPNEESAELIKEKMLLMQEMHAFAHAMNDGWLPDWNDVSQNKHGIAYERNSSIIEFKHYNYFIFGIAVKSEEIAEQMLKEFGERIEKYYNKQY